MIPPKLNREDEVRIIAPSYSLAVLTKTNQQHAKESLESMGLIVSYSRNAAERDEFVSSSIESRIADIHDAFGDKNVKAILTVIGGFNSNHLLRYLDYSHIRRNPKILCGFSDITALCNAIYAKTGLVTYSGPHFSSFAMLEGREYTDEHFRKCLASNGHYAVLPARRWSDDPWYRDQNRRKFIKNEGYWVINQGSAEGTIIGGNLCTINLLQGTEFMPGLRDSILFLEDDDLCGRHSAKMFDRYLQSLIHQPGFSGVRGIVIGRFQKASEVTREKISMIVKTKKELDNIPVIANADFGHTTPVFTFPLGGRARFDTASQSIEMLEH